MKISTSCFFPKVHPEGRFFVFVAILMAIILASHDALLAGLLVVSYIVYFFRDPDRVTPDGNDLVVSPADGLVQSVDRDVPLPLELQDCPAAFEGRFIRVSIFLSVFNVHVNRIPVSGIVKKMIYCPGKFINASLDKASSDNERQYVSVETGKGEVVHFTQIAGLIARRIVCNLEEGQNVVRGERFGIIRFGSKMDIYLPANYKVQVLEGQIVIGGETILAEMRVTGDE